jgi:hypothetical protein
LTTRETTKDQQYAAAPEIELRHLCLFIFGKGNLAVCKGISITGLFNNW